jgi:hypothetical protein
MRVFCLQIYYIFALSTDHVRAGVVQITNGSLYSDWIIEEAFPSRQWQDIFLFSNASLPALGSTEPLIQCVMESLSLVLKRPAHGAEHSPISSAEGQNEWSSISTPHVFMAYIGAHLPLPQMKDQCTYRL